jgi:hypothetical protein
MLRALSSVNVAGARKPVKMGHGMGFWKMRQTGQAIRCSLCCLLFVLPACQCMEGHWPWSSSEPTVIIDAPSSEESQLDQPLVGKVVSKSSQPKTIPAPVTDSKIEELRPVPSVQTDKKEIPNSTHTASNLAPTDPPPLTLPRSVQTPPVVTALQLYFDGRPDEAVKMLAAYDAKDQEVLLCLLPLLAQFGRGGLWWEHMSSEERLANVQQLKSLTRDLERAAPLVIEHATFCRDIEGYGQPIRVPNTMFRPGDRVRIYVEVQNLIDREIKSDQFAVQLNGFLEILDVDGKAIWSKTIEGQPSLSESLRNDHFTQINFGIPRYLSPGNYTLRIGVADQQTNRRAQQTLQFRVAGSVSANTIQ